MIGSYYLHWYVRVKVRWPGCRNRVDGYLVLRGRLPFKAHARLAWSHAVRQCTALRQILQLSPLRTLPCLMDDSWPDLKLPILCSVNIMQAEKKAPVLNQDWSRATSSHRCPQKHKCRLAASTHEAYLQSLQVRSHEVHVGWGEGHA